MPGRAGHDLGDGVVGAGVLADGQAAGIIGLEPYPPGAEEAGASGGVEKSAPCTLLVRTHRSCQKTLFVYTSPGKAPFRANSARSVQENAPTTHYPCTHEMRT